MAIAPVGLLTAALDLSLVRMLRRAINSPGNLTPSGLGPIPTYPLGPGGAGGIGPRPVHEPEPRLEPRPVVHPTPRIEPRLVHHPEPRVVELPPAVESPREPEMSRVPESPLAPPWKHPLWEKLPPVPPPTVARLKMFVQRPDALAKGSVFDTFI